MTNEAGLEFDKEANPQSLVPCTSCQESHIRGLMNIAAANGDMKHYKQLEERLKKCSGKSTSQS